MDNNEKYLTIAMLKEIIEDPLFTFFRYAISQYIWFCASIEWDIEEYDYGPCPVCDIVKTYNNGKPVIAFVYNPEIISTVKNTVHGKTVSDAINAIRQMGLSDDANILMMDQNSGKLYPVIDCLSMFGGIFFITSETKLN